MTVASSSFVNPGVIRGMIAPDKINMIRMKKKSPIIIKLIIDEILLLSLVRSFSYLMNIGINAELNAPLIKISKTKSGKRNEAKKRSSISFEKNVANVLYLRNPNILDTIIMKANTKTEERISFCLIKIIFFVLFKNFSMSAELKSL